MMCWALKKRFHVLCQFRFDSYAKYRTKIDNEVQRGNCSQVSSDNFTLNGEFT